jgi:hypothetical protein
MDHMHLAMHWALSATVLEKAPHPSPLPEGRAALNEAALRRHSRGERGHVKLCPLRRRSRGERASPCADTVAPEGVQAVSHTAA